MTTGGGEVREGRPRAAGLGVRVARGLTWTLTGLWGGQAINLVVFVVLARIVDQQAFGLVSLAAVFVAFAQIFLDQGLGDALVQRDEIERRHADTAFWATLSMGALLAAIGMLASGAIATLLGEPALGPVVAALSLSFLLSGLTATPSALLRRDLAFRALTLRALVAQTGGGLVGLGLAVGGYGVWALVGQALASGLFSVATLWTANAWRPGRDVSWPTFRQLFGFGANVVGVDLLTFLNRRSDNLLIGAAIGTVALGYYAIAYRLLETATQLLLGFSAKIVFPALSRLQDEPERARPAFFRVMRMSNLLVLPAFVGLSLVAGELIPALFGSKWLPSVPVATTLYLVGIVYSISYFSGAYLKAMGHAGTFLRFRILGTIVNVVGFIIAVPFGIHAVAIAFVLRAYLLVPVNLFVLRRATGLSLRAYLAQFVPAATATAVMAVAVVAVKLLLGDSLETVPLLVAEVLTGMVVYSVALLVLARSAVREGLEIARMALLPRRDAGARAGRRRGAGPGGGGRRRRAALAAAAAAPGVGEGELAPAAASAGPRRPAGVETLVDEL